MKKVLSILLIIISVCFAGYVILNYSGKFYSGIVFLAGMTAGISLGSLKINSKNKVLNSYKRELEKEAIASDENASRVKVLESKIEVLEKALENALKK